MPASNSNFATNPFSLQNQRKTKPKRTASKSSALRRSIKVLVFVGCCFSVTIMLAYQSRRWVLHQLTSEFDSLEGDEKISRLGQISDLGVLGVEPLVKSMADEDISVARTSFDLLQELQNEWTVLNHEDLVQRHQVLVAALNSNADALPDDRTGWAASLLQQTISESVASKDPKTQQLYKNAGNTLAQFNLSTRTTTPPSPKQDTSTKPETIEVVTTPLPVEVAEGDESWTDWPPPNNVLRDRESIDNRATGESIANQSPTDPPSIYRNGSVTLQPIQPQDASPIESASRHETSFEHESAKDQNQDVPLTSLSDRSVIFWLGDPDPNTRQNAKAELVSRGFNPQQISIASQIATADGPTRVHLVDAISRSIDVDPRPWLMMLLDDDNREVRLRTISVLATMHDPAIQRELRLRMVDQSDPVIAARLKRLLNVR